MARTLSVGDSVSWGSEEGRIRGKVTQVHHKPLTLAGHHFIASTEDPRYEVRSDKTGAHAVHKGAALRKLKS